MMDQWKPGRLFFRVAVIAAHTHAGNVPKPLQPAGQFYTLEKATLYYVKADMAKLVTHAAETLPPATLTEDLAPTPFGFAVFEEPLIGKDSMTAEPVHIWAIAWAEGQIVEVGKGLVLQFYGRVDREEFRHTAYLYPYGNTDWPYNTDTDVVVDPESADDSVRLASMSEDRRWFAAMWLLASQPLSETVNHRADRGTARRSARAKVSSDVRLVDLRARPTHEPSGTGRKVDWSHRWIVGGENGGFWRQQAYGPGHSLRRPVWINEYIKGPAEKPLRVKDTVRIIRGETGPGPIQGK